MPSEWKIELIARHDSLTEGPVWDGEALLYTEIAADTIWRYEPGSKRRTAWRRDTHGANGLEFDAQGRLFACEGGGRRIVQYAADQPTAVVTDSFEGNQFNEPNDLAIDRRGRIWFTDPNYGGRPMQLTHESVYRADPLPGNKWKTTRVVSDTVRPNGILVSPDQKWVYVAESPRPPEAARQLRAYPIKDDGSTGPFEVLHDFGPHRGIDGMCLDISGDIVATAGFKQSGPGPMIYVFAPNGRVLETHPLPAERPTNCTFAERGLDTLYITAAGGEVFRVANTGRQGFLLYPPVNPSPLGRGQGDQ
ncbi:MAG: SMP-30/gluconolactonase/LRE family protein [Chloroflexi bacterium]|nr:SMP-30/gluconolactonase/LRE family protein [Chloroflexota bacterium]